MGTAVAKMFGGELFRGSIVNVDEDAHDGTVLYHIKYQDEDREDLSLKECSEAIKLYKQIETGEIEEWTIGDE